MTTRNPGWYWVKAEGQWIPWEWIAESEVVCARWADGAETWIEEVGPRIPYIDEPWKSVPLWATTKMLTSTNNCSTLSECYEAMISSAPNPEDAQWMR